MADKEIKSDKFIPPFTYNGEAMENIGGYPKIESLEIDQRNYTNMIPPVGSISAIIYCSEDILANTGTGFVDFPIPAGTYFPLSVAQLRGTREFNVKPVTGTCYLNIFYTMQEVRSE